MINSSIRNLISIVFVYSLISEESLIASENCSLVENQTLSATDPNDEAFFGSSVAIDGNYAVVGSPGINDFGAYTGAAYVFHHNGEQWNFVKKLVASDPAEQDWFGKRVAITGTTIAVSARLDDDACPTDEECDSGSVYIFEKDGFDIPNSWSEVQKITATDGAQDDVFGTGLALDGDNLLIGAIGAEAVYVYERYKKDPHYWLYKEKLTASDADEQDAAFGVSIAIDGNRAVIGAKNRHLYPEGESPVFAAGAVYVFHLSKKGWVEQTKLIAENPSNGDHFGALVALSNDVVAISAGEDDDACPEYLTCDSGAVYLYRHSKKNKAWTLEQKIRAADNVEGDYFGAGLAIDGSWLVVGASGHDTDGIESRGKAYLFQFENSSWNEKANFKATWGTFYDNFGTGVDIDNGLGLIGSWWDDIAGPQGGWLLNAGTVHAFDGFSDNDGDQTPDLCECQADFNQDGAIDSADIEILFEKWGWCSVAYCAEDLNQDDEINAFDLAQLLAEWGSCWN